MPRLLRFACALALAATLSACGWKPTVTPVPITPPWSNLNFPVKENAAVWASSPTEFKAQHKGDRKAVSGAYVDSLKAQGWQLVKFDNASSNWYIDMSKGADKIQLEFYDFKDTGVIIRRK